MIRVVLFMLLLAFAAGCGENAPLRESSDPLVVTATISEGAGPCTFRQDTACRWNGVWCETRADEIIQDPDGHVKPNCGFDHGIQVCNPEAWAEDECDLISGWTTKCK